MSNISNFISKGRFCNIILMLLSVMYLSVSIRPVIAYPAKPLFTPNSGMKFAEESKKLDVEYVPSLMEVVNEMLNIATVGPNDFLIDLGSGDGRIVITAAKKFGARGLGIELNSKLVDLSKQNAIKAGVSDRTEFIVENFFKANISQADVITLYILTDLNLKLRPKLLNELKPGARVVSQSGHMGEWRPDKTTILDIAIKDRKKTFLYCWIVPAKVEGNWGWRMPLIMDNPPLFFRDTHKLEIKQKFQNISGVVENHNRKWPIFNAHLLGDQIRFSISSEAADNRIIRQDYIGRIEGNIIRGTVTLSGAVNKVTVKWKATQY